MNSIKLWTKFLYFITVLSALMLFNACILYFTGISRVPILGIVSILTPLILITNILLSMFWLFKRQKILFLPLAALIFSFFIFGSFYKFKSAEKVEDFDELSIMSFNARGFNKYQQIKLPDLDDQIIELVKTHEPDIVCFQEFDYTHAQELDLYPFQYVSYIFPEDVKVVQAILSKFPIVEKGIVNFPESTNNTIYADIQYGEELLRVYNVHLQSFKIIPSTKRILSEPGEKFIKRLQNTFLKQQEQAELVHEHMKSTPSKTIVCADLNNTAYSNAYRLIRGKLIDSYNEKGSGFGKSFYFFGTPLRIDYILVDPAFEVMGHKNLDVKLSDHLPLLASIRLHRNKTTVD